MWLSWWAQVATVTALQLGRRFMWPACMGSVRFCPYALSKFARVVAVVACEATRVIQYCVLHAALSIVSPHRGAQRPSQARARTPDRDIYKRYPVQTPPPQSFSLVPTHHRRLILIRRHIPTPSSIRARACPRIDAYAAPVGQSQVRAATSGLTRTPSIRQLCCPECMTSGTSTRSPCGQFCQCTYVDRQGGSAAASLSLLYNYKRLCLLRKYVFHSTGCA